MSSACAQIGAWGQVNKMEEVEVNTLGDHHIGCQIDLKNQRMTLALSKVIEVWAGMEAQSQQPLIGK